MKVLSFIQKKGGVGKSTTCVNMAAYASGLGLKTLIVDCDPQESATSVWFENRPEIEYPKCEAINYQDLPLVVTQAAHQGYDLLFIDSAGRDSPSNKLIADVSDVIIMPARPSAYDVVALDDTISGMTKERHKIKIVISQGFSQGKRNEIARDVLSGIEGVEISPTVLVNRAIYLDSAEEGLGVTELSPSSKASNEIKQLWNWAAA